MEDTNSGTYVCARLNDESKSKIKEFIEENNIENPIKTFDLHCTIISDPNTCLTKDTIYSRYEEPIVAEPIGFEMIGEASLTISLDCPGMLERHNFYKTEHNLEHQYLEYKVHITISYLTPETFNIGSLDASALGELVFTTEKVEEYVDNWVSVDD